MWQETGREVHRRRSGELWTYIIWRCYRCKRMAVSGGETPSQCVCRAKR